MSLKDNFNQAVREVLKKERLVGDDLSKKTSGKTESDRLINSAFPVNMGSDSGETLSPGVSAPEGYGTGRPADDFTQRVNEAQAPEAPDTGDMTFSQSRTEDDFGRFEYQTSQDPFSRTAQNTQSAYAPPPPMPSTGYFGNQSRNSGANAFRGGRPPETPYYETEETTVISRNTRINGSISSFANVNIEGGVQGDVRITKNISVSGKVKGDVECNNAVLTGAQMEGSLASKGQVQIDHDSLLLGNIDTQYLDMNGRMKGDVNVGGKAEFKNDAFIVGNITASTISVIDGASIKGFVNTTFMQDSASNIFPESVLIEES